MDDTLLKGGILLPEEIEDIILEDEELAQLESEESGSGLVEDVIIDEDGDIVSDTLIDDSEPDGDLIRDAEDDPALNPFEGPGIADDGIPEGPLVEAQAPEAGSAGADKAEHPGTQVPDESDTTGTEAARDKWSAVRSTNVPGVLSDSLPDSPAGDRRNPEGEGEENLSETGMEDRPAADGEGPAAAGTLERTSSWGEGRSSADGEDLSAAGTREQSYSWTEGTEGLTAADVENRSAADAENRPAADREDMTGPNAGDAEDSAREGCAAGTDADGNTSGPEAIGEAAASDAGDMCSVKESTAAKEDAKTARTKVVVGVRFRSAGKSYYFATGDLPVKRGSHVIVETSRGLDYGTSICDPIELDRKQFRAPVKRIVRIATPADESRVRDMREKERDAYRICYEKIRRRGLDMKLIEAEYAFDGSKLLFYFTADERVDFRDLVKDLAGVFHTRIELRQIGVRDETRILGGYGICGRPLCCHTYLSDFAPVSIKMAKEQNLSLNPTKISGSCGRLMCCLKNEEEVYEELNQNLPKPGDEVEGNDGLTGEVIGVDILRQLVRILVEVDDQKELHEYPADSITILRRRKRGQAKPKVNRNELRDPKGRKASSSAGRGHADAPVAKDSHGTIDDTEAPAESRETIRSMDGAGRSADARTGENLRNSSPESSPRGNSRRERSASPASARRGRQDNHPQPDEPKDERTTENEGRADLSVSRRSTRRSRQGTGSGRSDRTVRNGEAQQSGQRVDVRAGSSKKDTGRPSGQSESPEAENVIAEDNGTRQENSVNRSRHRRNRRRNAAAADHAVSTQSPGSTGNSEQNG